MQRFSVLGIILFWAARFALPCLSLPFSLKLSPGMPVGTISEGFGDQVNSSFMVTEEMEEEELETKLEGVQVEEGVEGVQDVRNQQVGFHNDSHGTLISKGW